MNHQCLVYLLQQTHRMLELRVTENNDKCWFIPFTPYHFHILGNLEALANLNTSELTNDVFNTDLPSPKSDNGDSQETSTKRRSKSGLSAHVERAGNSSPYNLVTLT